MHLTHPRMACITCTSSYRNTWPLHLTRPLPQGWAFHNSKSSIPNRSTSPFGGSQSHTSRPAPLSTLLIFQFVWDDWSSRARRANWDHRAPWDCRTLHNRQIPRDRYNRRIVRAWAPGSHTQRCGSSSNANVWTTYPISAFSKVATPMLFSTRRPEVSETASVSGRLIGLYEEHHTLSIPIPYFLSFDADVAS